MTAWLNQVLAAWHRARYLFAADVMLAYLSLLRNRVGIQVRCADLLHHSAASGWAEQAVSWWDRDVSRCCLGMQCSASWWRHAQYFTLPPPCSWFYDTKLYWAECSWPCNVHISYGERFVYCLILGFYVQVCRQYLVPAGPAAAVAKIEVQTSEPGGSANGVLLRAMCKCPICHPCCQAVPMLFLWETKRKDRLEVFAHHVATIVLIAYSYYLKSAQASVLQHAALVSLHLQRLLLPP